MQIFVKTIQDETLSLQIDPLSTIQSLKDQISLQTSVPSDLQRLVYQGAILSDEQLISESLMEESTLYLSLGLLGGKKGKKKNYTTKKKNKHKHKGIKFSTLKYYSIDKEKKVVRMRKVCANCGPGYFMALNIDRHYCGRCHLTLKLDAAAIKAAQEALKAKKAAQAAAPKEEEAPAKGGKKDAKKGGKKK
jgi:ubiquitin-small subunit ribosomal protein S27Ae